jgi:hypothetical protein
LFALPFYLQLPPPCSPPPLPRPSHCLTASHCLRRQLFPTFADSLTASRLTTLNDETFAPTNQSGQFVPH